MAIELGGAPIIGSLLNLLVPMVSDGISRFWDVEDEMVQLRRTLEAIQSVLADAVKKQVNDQSIQLWLRRLRDIAYDADDILDEYAYESLREEIETGKRIKVRNFFSPSSNFLVSRSRMGSKLKDINKKLVQIQQTQNMFHLSTTIANLSIGSNTAASNIGQSSRQTISYATSEIVGRERAASDVRKLLSSSNKKEISSSIIRIVGMGGLGKTALSQIVYNSWGISQFEVKMWVCVSQNSDQMQVFKKLLESIRSTNNDVSNLSTMVDILKEKLHNKRYLIVLDDMWNDRGNDWNAMLGTLLLMGAQGSKVIVTTRSTEVIASMVNSLSNYNLVGLADEESWVLLEKIVFGHEEVQKPANLIEIGKRIAKKCGGVPLAIKVLGGLMQMEMSQEHWRSIEGNVIWETEEGEEKIIKVLKLSYDHLEPHLQQCFTYCSLFPKGHSIKRKTLIQLWMAEGFLAPVRQNCTEMEVGNRYFNSLLRNSFFHEVKKDDKGNIKSLEMHDLLHDLAEFLTRTDFLQISLNGIPEENRNTLRGIRLFRLFGGRTPSPEVLTLKGKRLRALLCPSANFVDNAYAAKQIFFNFRHLRVLDLKSFWIDELPPAIENLKHLRYLNLSYSKLTKLPTSITTLYNLQTLMLKNCIYLHHLPPDMSKLKDIRHLDISISKKGGGLGWNPPMPSQVRNFSKLQCLPLFTVGNKSDGFGIEELGSLNLLGGKIRICNLENVSCIEDAAGACIREKQLILWLELHWRTAAVSRGRDDLQVLQGLQPHWNLRKLGIHNYVGLYFSTWLMNLNNFLPNLVYIALDNCSTCESLPPLGLLPFLKVLILKDFPALKSIGSDFFVGNSSSGVSFPCLEDLSILFMDSLEHISESLSFSSSFPVLQKLNVSFCPKLRIMPIRIIHLKELTIRGCICEAEAINSLVKSNLKSLTSVLLWNCKEISFLPLGLFKWNYVLKNIQIYWCHKFAGFIVDPDDPMEEDVEFSDVDQDDSKEEEGYLNSVNLVGCPALVSLPSISRFNHLESLEIFQCESLVSLPRGIENLLRLRSLFLGPFSQELDSFPFPAATIVEERIVGLYFRSLTYLCITGWSKLDCLPDQIQHIVSLQHLSITKFDSLEAVPEWLGNMDFLEELSLLSCKELKYMPSEEQMLRLTSLQRLVIKDCPLLADTCAEGGEEHYKLHNIPRVLINKD